MFPMICRLDKNLLKTAWHRQFCTFVWADHDILLHQINATCDLQLLTYEMLKCAVHGVHASPFDWLVLNTAGVPSGILRGRSCKAEGKDVSHVPTRLPTAQRQKQTDPAPMKIDTLCYHVPLTAALRSWTARCHDKGKNNRLVSIQLLTICLLVNPWYSFNKL